MSSTTAKFSGIRLKSQSEFDAEFQAYHEAICQGHHVPPPSRVQAIFQTQDGIRYASNTITTKPLPFENKDLAAFDSTKPSQGGFLAIASLSSPTTHDQYDLQLLVDRQLSSKEASSYPQPVAIPSSSHSLGNLFREYFSNLPELIAQNWARNTLQNLFLGGGLGDPLAGLGSVSNDLISLIGGPIARSSLLTVASLLRGVDGDLPDLASLASGVLPALTNKLLDAWQIEDSDSTSEQLAHHFASKWKDSLTDPSAALDKLKSYFKGQSSSAVLGALRLSDVDIGSNPVTMASTTVFAEGIPVARVGDTVKSPGNQVYKGAATVFTEGSITGRKLDSVSEMGLFATGASTVFIGGPTGGLGPNDPPACQISDGNMTPAPPQVQIDKPAENDDEGWGQFKERYGLTDDELKKIKDMPDDAFRREFNNRDGYSSNQFERDRLEDWGDEDAGWFKNTLRDLMRADENGTTTLGFPMKNGNWYLLGGLIDLGSPEWPGAGTGTQWYIPDRIGPYSMADYYARHDATFDPANQNMMERLGVELDAFAHGIQSDLIKLILQVIYSDATTVVSVTTDRAPSKTQ